MSFNSTMDYYNQNADDFAGFAGALQDVLKPVYQSAVDGGFKNWIYTPVREDIYRYIKGE